MDEQEPKQEWVNVPPHQALGFRCECGFTGALHDPKAILYMASKPTAAIEIKEPCPTCSKYIRITRPEQPKIVVPGMNRETRRAIAANARRK